MISGCFTESMSPTRLEERVTQQFIPVAPGPADDRSAYRLHFDTEVTGLALQVTKSGARAFVFNYRTVAGRERRLTIGSTTDWSLTLVREEAKRLRRLVDQGRDPMGERHELRAAATVTDLVVRWRIEVAPKKRARARADDEGMIAGWILPALGRLKLTDVKHADIAALHREITAAGALIRANRVIALCSRLFRLAIVWEMCSDNPVKGIERNPEPPRHRYLSSDEIVRLFTALETLHNRQAADIIRLLALTGARRSEVFAMRWSDLDLQAGVWLKPAAATKQHRIHRIPLNEPAKQLLIGLKLAATDEAARTGRPLPAYAFPGRGGRAPIGDIKKGWAVLCRKAQLGHLHLYDLRHNYASLLVSAGYGLPLIGALLGHSQLSTTSRYAHLMDGAQRQATDELGAIQPALPPPAMAAPADHLPKAENCRSCESGQPSTALARERP
jgi:integrase